jgi:hypothetical protein
MNPERQRPSLQAAKAANERALEIAKNEALQRSLDIRALMKTHEFRRFIHAELSACGLNADTWTSDARQTDYLAGRRGYAVQLAREVESLDQDGYLLMLREAMGEKAAKK